MKAVIKRPGTSPNIVDIENTLEALQEAVGGRIECVYTGIDVIICNEEGRLLMLPDNVVIGTEYFVGTILIVGTDGEDFTDVSDAEYWFDYLDQKDHQL